MGALEACMVFETGWVTYEFEWSLINEYLTNHEPSVLRIKWPTILVHIDLDLTGNIDVLVMLEVARQPPPYFALCMQAASIEFKNT